MEAVRSSETSVLLRAIRHNIIEDGILNSVRGVRFEVFTAETMKDGIFWDITPCGFCKN
jgi:hypothetical protein